MVGPQSMFLDDVSVGLMQQGVNSTFEVLEATQEDRDHEQINSA